MPLPSIQQPVVETLDEAKSRIEIAVSAAIGQQDVVEIEVPYSLSGDLREWVENEGMRCGRQILPNRTSILVINTILPPLPAPPAPTPEQIQAEIDLAAQHSQEISTLNARVAALEAELAALQGGG